MNFEKIRSIISEQLNVPEEEITMDTSFLEDLNADSLEVVELILLLEQEFGVSFPDTQADKFLTVGNVVDYIENNI